MLLYIKHAHSKGLYKQFVINNEIIKVEK